MPTESLMRRKDFPLELLRDEGALASLLVSATSTKRLPNACIGVLANGRRVFAATDEAFLPRPTGEARDRAVRAGCFAKPITASLLATAVAEGETTWNSSVSDVLGVTGTGGRALARVNMRQLLNHTHGLDASTVAEVPRTIEGRIDVQTLCDHLAPTPISDPGRLYSYGSVGSWLAGAVLEKIYSCSYKRLLFEKFSLAAPFDSEMQQDTVICPATGGDLSLTTQRWLLFLESHVRSFLNHAQVSHKTCLHTLLTDQTPLPGWSPAEHASCLGWKSYGSGWFGHNSNSPHESAVIRFSLDQQVAIIVSAYGNAAFVALATIFGRSMPEFANFRVPRMLKPKDCELVNFSQYVGIYRQARTSIVITQSSPTMLSYGVRSLQLGESLTASPLRAAADDVFFPSDTSEFAFIQFVRSNKTTQVDYVWNGKQLWRRI